MDVDAPNTVAGADKQIQANASKGGKGEHAKASFRHDNDA